MKKIILTIIVITAWYLPLFAQEDFWEKINVPTKDSIFTFATNKYGLLFIGTQREGIYRSDDNGSFWFQINDGLKKLKITNILSGKKGNLFANVINDGIYISFNHGASWEKITSSLDSQINSNTIIENNLNELFIGTNSGIYKSTNDGIDWENITSNIGIKNISVPRIITNKGNTLFAQVGGNQLGFYRKRLGDSDWKKLILSDYDVASIRTMVVNTLDEIYIGTFYNGIFKTLDGGEKIEKIQDTILTKFVRTLNINRNDHLFGIIEGRGLLRSIDKGDSWSAIDTSFLSKIMKSLWTDNNNYLIGITLDFKLYRSSQPMEIFNLTTKFSSDTIPILDYLDTLSLGIEISDRKSNELLKNVDIKVFNSITNDTTMLRSDSLGYAFYQVIVPENIDTGLYRIKYISSKFAYINDTTTFQVYVKHAEVSVKGNNNLNSLFLTQNYPNPFSTNTEIKFDIQNPDFVTLKIFDELGREIKTLVDDYLDAGEHSAQFDGTGLTTGVYFYCLRTSKGVETRNMVYIAE